MAHCKQQTSSKDVREASGADPSPIHWPGAVVVEATDTPEDLGP